MRNQTCVSLVTFKFDQSCVYLQQQLAQMIWLLFLCLDEQPSTNHLMADLSRKMPWSDQETRTLLEVWGDEHVQLTLRGCLKNRHVFEYISEKMSEQGFMRTSEQCYTRIKRLKYSFLHEKYEAKLRGDFLCEVNKLMQFFVFREEFKFFSEMDKIFRKESKVNDSVRDMLVTDELDDCTPDPGQKKGETNQELPT